MLHLQIEAQSQAQVGHGVDAGISRDCHVLREHVSAVGLKIST